MANSPTPAQVAAHNLTAHGAVGDGTTDDSAALADALSAAASDGLPVYVPPGTFRVGPFTVSAAVDVFGAGQRSVLLLAPSSAAPLVTVTSADVTISHLVLDGGSAAQTQATGCLVVATDADRFSIEDCQVGRSLGTGIELDAADALVAGCRVDSTGGAGIDVRATGTVVNANHISNSAGPAISVSAPADGSGDSNLVALTGNSVSATSAGAAILVTGSARGVSVTANTVIGGGGDGIAVDGATETTVYGNTVSGTAGAGIRLGACNRVTVTSNAVARAGADGISSGPAAVGVVLEGNTVTTSGLSGITIDGSTDFVVSTNACFGNGTLGGSRAAGITLAPTTAVARGIVGYNTCTDDPDSPAQRDGIEVAGTCTGVTLSTNAVAGNGSSGIAYQPASLVGGTVATPGIRLDSVVVGPDPTPVPHGLDYTPISVVVAITGPGSVWRCQPSDATNVYLQADAAGRTCRVTVG